MAEKKFGNKTFRCEKMVATEATGYVFRLGRLAAPLLKNISSLSLASLAGDGNTAASIKTLEAISSFLMQLDPTEGQKMVVELAEKAQVQSQQGNFEQVIYDQTFGQDLLLAFQVAAWVIQVNFSDFFGGKLDGVSLPKMPG